LELLCNRGEIDLQLRRDHCAIAGALIAQSSRDAAKSPRKYFEITEKSFRNHWAIVP
jgi:hypothetical protein